MTGKWIGVQFLAAELGDGVHALASVYGVDRHQNAELRGDLNQRATSHGARLRRVCDIEVETTPPSGSPNSLQTGRLDSSISGQ